MRLCDMTDEENVNLEYKAFDATANPYVGMCKEPMLMSALDFLHFSCLFYFGPLTFRARHG